MIRSSFFCFLFFLLSAGLCFAEVQEDEFLKKLQKGPPEWMLSQITKDLAYFQNRKIAKSKIASCYEAQSVYSNLAKITIKQNKVSVEKKWHIPFLDPRLNALQDALVKICSFTSLPDVVFLASVQDANFYPYSDEVPVFVMCKDALDNKVILFPDFEALREKYQVLEQKDITCYEIPWHLKKSQLMWRGSTAQHGYREALVEENVSKFSRVTLCALTQKHPQLINAKFTIFGQGGERIPYLQTLKGDKLSFEEQVLYKYQILIDGNATSYSNSCWKWFSNSVVFQPDSPWVQWYFSALKPYEHFVPVHANLDNLVEKITWVKENDALAEKIAKNARLWAKENLTGVDNYLYLTHLIKAYSQLQFTEK